LTPHPYSLTLSYVCAIILVNKNVTGKQLYNMRMP
jgi:hypothetical protein